jgi:Rieske 2Fe-2S family protein
MEGNPVFDRDEYPLHEAHIREFEGFIFVALDPAVSFDEYIAPLAARFSAWGLADVRAARRITYDLACNWKLAFQNYSECYHCPVLHPQLEKLSPSDSGRNDLTQGPFLGGYSTLRTPETSLTTSGQTRRKALPGVHGDELLHVYYYTIFPSMLLSLHPDYVMVHYVQPLAPDRTSIVCEWYFDPAAMSQPDFDPSDAVEFWDLTNRQDWHVNELTQQGIASRAYQPGPYSQQEGLLHAFDVHYLQTMA